MRFNRILASALAGAALFGCVDSPTSSIAPGEARLILAPQFIQTGQSASLPIAAIRVTPRFTPSDSAAGEPTRIPVNNPDAESFSVDVPIDMGGRDSAQISVLIELLSRPNGEDIVEWSALVGPVTVVEGEPTEAQPVAQLYRGPIENAGVVSIDVFGPPSMVQFTSHPAYAVVETEASTHSVVWSSSDTDVLIVEPVGDSIDIFALGEGEAWVVGAAGIHADSFLVHVSPVGGGGPVAEIIAFPDSAVMVPASTRQWQAFAFDSTGLPTFPTFSWLSLDPTIASVSSTGLVTAIQLGRARIVVSAEVTADTFVVNVQPLPEGVDIIWQGGSAIDPGDWFTPDNWSPSRVPTASDIVYIPSGSALLQLEADAEIGGLIGDANGGFIMDILGETTLTVHGDLLMPFIFADSAARVVIDAPSARIAGLSMPNLTVLGDLDLVDDVYVYGDFEIDGTARGGVDLLVRSHYLAAEGDFTAVDATATILYDETTFESGGVFVQGDMLVDGGAWTDGLTSGSIFVGGDFTVSSTCGSFAPLGTYLQLVSDTATISIGCAGPTQNRLHDLYVYQATDGDRVLELASDVYVDGELYLDGGEWTYVLGNGHTFRARSGNAYWSTFDHVFIEVVGLTNDDLFSTDSIVITGMTGETRPQVYFAHPGFCAFSCYGNVGVIFDPTSAGPYIEAEDTEANGDSLILYMKHNPGDGPARTVTTGAEVAVHWADVPVYFSTWSGNFQSGSQHQPLPDSLVVQISDYAFFGVDGATVDFEVSDGDGSVSPASAVTDENGLAATQFTMGDTIFTSQEVIATNASLPADTVVFSLFPTAVSGQGIAQPALETRPAAPVRNPPGARREPTAWPTPVIPRHDATTGEDR